MSILTFFQFKIVCHVCTFIPTCEVKEQLSGVGSLLSLVLEIKFKSSSVAASACTHCTSPITFPCPLPLQDRVFLYSLSCPVTCSVDQVGIKLWPTCFCLLSAGIKVFATTYCPFRFLTSTLLKKAHHSLLQTYFII